MSISKAQAAAIADGFLDTVGGDDKRGLEPRETFSEIVLLAGELVEDMQANLNQSTNNASGRLSESIQAGEPVKTGDVLRIDIYMNFYGQFQNKGVKGTRAGISYAGYSFRNEFPSKNMVNAIRQWITLAKISTRTVQKYAGYGGHEIKNKSLSKIDDAYAKARSIKMYGIPPTGFLDKAAATTAQKVKERLGLALKVDIINSIT